jgi:hypothetical protein
MAIGIVAAAKIAINPAMEKYAATVESRSAVNKVIQIVNIRITSHGISLP